VQTKTNEGIRCADWFTYGNPPDKMLRASLLEYRDWDKYWLVDGGFYIMKKSTWRRAQWDESLFWNQGEDVKLSNDWKKQGVVVKFNPFSSASSFSWRHGEFPMCEFDKRELGRRKFSKIKEAKDNAKFYVKKIIGRA